MSLRAVVSLLLLAAPLAAPAAEGRLVLLPFDGQVGPTFRGAVLQTVMTALARRGYVVVGGEVAERFLEERRIRYLDSLIPEDIRELAEEFQADGVVVGAFLAIPDGPEPEAALAARLIRADGRMAWTATVGLSSLGEPGVGAVGEIKRTLRPAEQLTAAASQLFQGFPEKGAPLPVRIAGTTAGPAPRTYRAPGFFRERRRVCLLPFANATASQAAPRAVEAILARALGERNQFYVVEPAELRRAFVTEGIWSPRWLTLDHFRRLSARVGGCAFLSGDILTYGRTTDAAGGSTPAVEIYVSLVEPPAGRTVWSALHVRRGHEYEHLLGLGALQTRFEVGEQVVQELVKGLFAP